MQGEIEVQSKIGEGSVFTLKIPITNNAPLQTNSLSDLEPLHDSTAKEVVSNSELLSGNNDELPIALIIEDNKDIVTFLRSCIEGKYKVEVSINGKLGIDKALDIIPDVIISDVMMPETDGYTVCHTLKSDERTSHVPIILLTAKVTQEDKERGLEVGADAYLTKPFHPKELDIRLEKLVQLRHELQKRFTDQSESKHSTDLKEDEFIQKLRAIIEENMEDESFGIMELCRIVGLSRMQVHRKLKALTGNPTTHLIHQVRLQRADQLLRSTDLNISEVAYKVGFPDHSYFTKLFTKQYGHTPTDVVNSKKQPNVT